MNITFSETNKPDDLFSKNYWDVQQQQQEDPVIKKKKKVSFDDILNNMNLVVNDKGVLQYMTPLNDNEMVEQNINPLEKNGYIYNKYFKDYKNTEDKPVIRVPKNMQEYRQMLLEDKINKIKEQKRISQIKSTKLLLTNINPMYVSKNSLNKMHFY